MELGFIHIGMMKTATTYMQNVWKRDEKYCLSWRGSFELLESLRNSVVKGDYNANLKLNIKSDLSYKEGQKFILSNEGFSTAYLNQIKNQHKIPQFIDSASRNLSRLAKKKQNLLIVIRDPMSWLKSIHIQSIKEGGSGSATSFIEDQYNFLKHSLDLDYIVKSYERYFNILILPYELFKSDENMFWKIISEAFELPIVEERIENKINPSLDPKRTYLLSKLNEQSHMLTGTLIDSKDYNHIQEKEHIVTNYLGSGKWIHRRFVEFANDEKINELYNMMNIEYYPENYFDIKIPSYLDEVIKSQYIGFLRKNNILTEFADQYEQNLKDYIIR
ncbi:hypothetical protein SAMN05216389_10565 [Oceanobacillus limi]|uniref:Sulfotransferase family protein n=1 Tax=Oceanobacillus limi TaxID=930131 RepID=A0A1I0BKD5_9BACI|nr:hypothetical protein [Oceanobacillus limi]SET07440.1 hypothetical protein SAMN05216389_10565 [Oceanobacillus limi]